MKSEVVVIFLSFRKNKETKPISKFQKNLTGPSFQCCRFNSICRSNKFCGVEELHRTFEIQHKKGHYFHKVFDNSNLKYEKMKIAKIKK